MNVRLEGVQARVFVEHVEHLDMLVRELRVVASGQESGIAPVAVEITGVVEDIVRRYARVKDESYLSAREALARGEDRVTLEFDLPEQAAADVELLLGALERADEVCVRRTISYCPPVLRWSSSASGLLGGWHAKRGGAP